MEFRYNEEQFDPPAPVLDIDIANPVTAVLSTAKCQLDTGASITVIPKEIICILRLAHVDFTFVKDYYGNVSLLPTYIVNISLANRSFIVEVITTEMNVGCLGRDILNEWKVILDAREGVFSLEE